jgi:hypothetical protein
MLTAITLFVFAQFLTVLWSALEHDYREGCMRYMVYVGCGSYHHKQGCNTPGAWARLVRDYKRRFQATFIAVLRSDDTGGYRRIYTAFRGRAGLRHLSDLGV